MKDGHVLDTRSLCPPPTLRRHTLIPIVAYSQCFVAVAATGSFYRPFTGFLPIFFTVSVIFFFAGMGNKVVTFTEQQLEDYQVNGLFMVRFNCAILNSIFKVLARSCDVCFFFQFDDAILVFANFILILSCDYY